MGHPLDRRTTPRDRVIAFRVCPTGFGFRVEVLSLGLRVQGLQ